MNELQGQTFAGYDILAKLGQGGMGAVYQARQPLLNRQVALKVMAPRLAADQNFVARFLREAAAAANLSHPNLVQVYTAGESEGAYFIAMEFVDGESLGKRLARKGALPPREALAVVVYVAQALAYAWQKTRLIHRDIKPDNIFLSSAGEVKLGDLGLAKSLGENSLELTQSGLMMGSPHYISPEQARAVKDLDFRADIYSLGCTLFKMLTGRPPHEGDDALAVILKHLNDPAPDLFQLCPACPEPLGRLVQRMMAKNRDERPASYEELLAELMRVHEQLKHPETLAPLCPPVTVTRPVPPAPTLVKQPAMRWQMLVTAALGVVLLAAVGGMLVWAPWKKLAEQQEVTPLVAPPPAAVPHTPAPPVQPSVTPPPEAPPPTVTVPAAEQQLQQVLAKLKELNPGFDGLAKHQTENGQITSLKLSVRDVRDLSPLKALPALRKLQCSGETGSALDGLASLAGLALTVLDIHDTGVSDLRPLKGMPLRELDCSTTRVRDLAPLHEMPLEILRCSNVGISDLNPIRGKPLEELWCDHTAVRDLTPLKGMPLRILRVDEEQVTASAANLAVLKDLVQLESLNNRPAQEHLRRLAAAAPPPMLGRQPPGPGGFMPTRAPLPFISGDMRQSLVLAFTGDQAEAQNMVSDQSDYQNHGQLSGAAWTPDGRRGGAYAFNGSNAFIRVPHHDTLNVRHLTLAAWVKTARADGGWRRIFDKQVEQGFVLNIGGEGQWRGKAGVGVNSRFSTSERGVADGQWHHLVGTYNGASLCLFVDGKQQRNVAALGGEVGQNQRDLFIGDDPARQEGGGQNVGMPFEGVLDELMIFNRALRPEEIRALYVGGGGVEQPQGPQPAAKMPLNPRELRLGLYLSFGLETFSGARPGRPLAAPASKFAPTQVDAPQWAQVARQIGARVAVLTAKHESGFCLWDCEGFDFDLAASPCKSDIIGDFLAACRAEGVFAGLHYSIPDVRSEGRVQTSGLVSATHFALIKRQLKDLLTKYGEVDLLVLDAVRRLNAGQWNEVNELVRALAPACLVLKGEGKDYDMDSLTPDWFWQPNTRRLSAERLVARYGKAQAGNLLFFVNVGVAPDGRIPQPSVTALQRFAEQPHR